MSAEMTSFLLAVLNAVCDFLMTEPIYYFTGLLLLVAVAGFVKKFIEWR